RLRLDGGKLQTARRQEWDPVVRSASLLERRVFEPTVRFCSFLEKKGTHWNRWFGFTLLEGKGFEPAGRFQGVKKISKAHRQFEPLLLHQRGTANLRSR